MINTIKKVAAPIIIICLLAGSMVAPGVRQSFSRAYAESDEKVYYYLHDHLGGIEAVTDEDGNVVERRDYFPFGSEKSSDGESGESYGYTGKELDNESGLYYYGARYYDPAIGRFTQIDPLILDESSKPLTSVMENPQALNGYSYTLNNPMRYVDEEGEYGKDVHYDLTYFLAIKSGLSQGQSKIIAYRNQYIDENPETAPSAKNWLNDPDKVERYHFRTRKEGIEILAEAITSKSSPAVGDALHTYQDTYSHEGLKPWDHIILSAKQHSPDRTFIDIDKSMRMAKNSFFYLRKFNRLTNGLNGLTLDEYRKETLQLWHDNKNKINAYLLLDDKKDTAIENEARETEEE